MLVKKNRILMINDHIHFGGGGDAAFQFERQIYLDHGYDVFTFSQAESISAGGTKNDFVSIEKKNKVLRKTGKFFFSFRVYRNLKSIIKSIKPDLISVHLVSKYPASVYAALPGNKNIQTLHGPNLFCATSWGCLKNNSEDCELGIGIKCFKRGCVNFPTFLLYKLLDWNTQFRVKNAITLFRGPSRQICESAKSLGYTPVEFMPLAVDRCFEEENINDLDPNPTILFVGAIVEQKGVDILLEAFSLVKRKVPNAKLIYAGRGDLLRVLKERSKLLGLEQSVNFLGFVEHDKIVELYQKVHVLAVPSVWKEQFGLVGPEALASKVPCVGSDIGGIPEWLHDGKWGFLVPPRNVEKLAEKLCLILEDEELQSNFGRNGREFVMANYDTQRYKENILRFAHELLNQEVGGSSNR